MTSAMPPRRPEEETAAAYRRLSAQGACCGHTRSVHAPDGCRVCQLQPRSTTPLCPGWQAPDEQDARYAQYARGGTPDPGQTQEQVGCPDSARCHYECRTNCWRVLNVSPMAGVFQGDRWPAGITAAHSVARAHGHTPPDDGVVDAEVLEPWAWLEQEDPDRLVPLAAVRAAFMAGHDAGTSWTVPAEGEAQAEPDWLAWGQEHGYYPATGELS